MARLKKKYKYVLDEDNIDIIEQFKTMCKDLEQTSKQPIDTQFYIDRYYLYTSEKAINEFKDIQERMYIYLKSIYPNIDFGIRGRTKSPFSYFQKILNKLEEDPHTNAYVNDECANKIFIRSRDCKMQKANYDAEGPYITQGKEIIRITPGDVLCVNFNGNYYNINVTSIAKSLDLRDNHIYVKTPEGLIIPIENGILKKCNNNYLIPFCYKFRDLVDEFCKNENGELIKQTDYIASPKESGYSSLQDSYVIVSKDFRLSTETQIKTADMEIDSKTNPKQKRSFYKPESKVLSPNSIYKVPIYILTTAFEPQKYSLEKFTCASIIASPEQCWNYTFKEKQKDNPELYDTLKEKYIALREKAGYKSPEKKLDELGITDKPLPENSHDDDNIR